MPELPEVETIVRELRARVLHLPIQQAKLIRTDLLKNSGLREADFVRFFKGCSFESIERRGKFLLFTLDSGVRLLAHLGMTGKFVVTGSKDADPKYLCSRYEFEYGLRLDHIDPRRLGRLELYSSEQDVETIQRLGTDPLSPEFGADSLKALVYARNGRSRRHRAVHTLLLDQNLISGVGNIYASEALFRAGIRPHRSAARITLAEQRNLAASLPEVLSEALRAGGTTVSNYRRVDDKPGEYRLLLRVYDREGEPCRRCGTAIKRIVLGARSAYYCPKCQK